MYFFFRIDVIKAYTAALIQTWDLAFGKGHTIGHYAVENIIPIYTYYLDGYVIEHTLNELIFPVLVIIVYEWIYI